VINMDGWLEGGVVGVYLSGRGDRVLYRWGGPIFIDCPVREFGPWLDKVTAEDGTVVRRASEMSFRVAIGDCMYVFIRCYRAFC